MPPDIAAPAEPPTFMPKAFVVLFAAYFVVLDVVLIWLLVRLWPISIPIAAADRTIQLFAFTPPITLPDEWRYLIIVVIAGALGSFVYLTTSFVDYVGNRQFIRSWSAWYILRPFIGSTLALVLYFVYRGGLVTGAGSSADNLSPFGVAALAGLAGWFSKEATDKLREVFQNFFNTTTPPDRSDQLKANP